MIGTALSFDFRLAEVIVNPLRKSKKIKTNTSDWVKRLELSKKYYRNDQVLKETIATMQKIEKNRPEEWNKSINGSSLSLAEFHCFLVRMYEEDFSAEQSIFIHSFYITQEKQLELVQRFDEQYFILEGVQKRLCSLFAY